MSNFRMFRDRLVDNFNDIAEHNEQLFTVNLDKDALWNLYLDSFPEGTNEIYRKRREYDCSCCRNFIKIMGNVVYIQGNRVKTIWDFDTGDDVFQQVADTLDSYVKSFKVSSVFIHNCKDVGLKNNYEHVKGEGMKRWEHFYLNLPDKYVNISNKSHCSTEQLLGKFNTNVKVFKRSLEEISEDSIEIVLELISQNSLYRGEEWDKPLHEFLKYKKEYMLVEDGLKSNYIWKVGAILGDSIVRIRNHSIGKLLTAITFGIGLDEAVASYEKIVAPTNYKRPKAIYTKKTLDEAKKKIEDLGYTNSLKRRFATLDDITINNILFSNKDVQHRIIEDDVFGELEKEVTLNPRKFDRIEEIGINDFVENVLPNVNELEVLFENRHCKNLVSLIAPANQDSKNMFKWNNQFSWTYTGNIADSDIRNNVKKAGGKIDGVLRFSIQWNDGLFYDGNDLDAHCIEPNGNEIYFANKKSVTTGELDVDILSPIQSVPAVENIVWTDINRMQKGTYRLLVHNFRYSGGKNGFKAEIEFDGKLYQFNYPKNVKHDEVVEVALVKFDGNSFELEEKLDYSIYSKEFWGIKTNQFIPVTVLMLSPNYWDKQKGIGNKHFFFMLKDCVNSEEPNAFYNEFLKEELLTHKRVLEALGTKLAVKNADEQLSGLGFSTTKRDDLIVKAKGSTERLLKIKI